MTPFTDDDLKRLKKLCAKPQLRGNDIKEFDYLTTIKIDAFFARLEAAEFVILEVKGTIIGDSCASDVYRAIEAWHKAAGK